MLFKKKNNKNRAFSLVELIVVVGIFTIITSITVFNYGRFSSNLIVTNLAYEAALAVRQAQVYGISVKQTSASLGGGNTANFNASYGVWFSTPQDFYLFADSDNDNMRSSLLTTTGKNIEDEESFTMNGSNIISDFCIKSDNERKCKKKGELDSLSIIFRRPEPNAKILGFLGGNKYAGTIAEIMFTSGRGDKRARMTVTNTGQISVDSCNNPSNSNQCPD